MKDVYLWTGLAVASLIAAAAVVALVRRWLDWQDRRTATAPTVFHTEVQEPLIPERSLAYGLDVIGAAVDEVLHCPPPHVDPHPTEPVWAVEAFFTARRLADERLEEFAGRTHATVAPIWAEIHGRRYVQGLAVA